MPAATLTISGPATKAGVASMKAQLAAFEAEFASTAAATPTADTGFVADAVELYERIAPNSRTREVLEILPGGKGNGLTPEQLAAQMAPGPGGSPVSRASARAALRVALRVGKKLVAEGVLQDEVVRIDWHSYNVEKAGRYYLDAHARKALDKHLRSNP